MATLSTLESTTLDETIWPTLKWFILTLNSKKKKKKKKKKQKKKKQTNTKSRVG